MLYYTYTSGLWGRVACQTPVRNRLNCFINIATDKVRTYSSIYIHTYTYAWICMRSCWSAILGVSDPQFRLAFAYKPFGFWWCDFSLCCTCTSKNRSTKIKYTKTSFIWKKKKINRKKDDELNRNRSSHWKRTILNDFRPLNFLFKKHLA